MRALIARGHAGVAYEPRGAWSLENLLRDHGAGATDAFFHAYPELVSLTYDTADDTAELCAGADLVIVHEWNDPALVARIGWLRARGAAFTLLFHDTHHRAVSDPDAIRAFDLNGYDGVLAFGESLAEVYRRWGWGNRVFVWHEAADVTLFRPPTVEPSRVGLVWVGNWGDGERSEELTRFLLAPARAAEMKLDIHGVRYPPEALDTLRSHGATYHGWLANAAAPGEFASHLATVHVPRRFYVEALPGIPTIRVFEALACGIPLVCTPWHDTEGLFSASTDYLLAASEAEMTRHLLALRADPDLRASLVRYGVETIRSRHTCDHRAAELLAIDASIRSTGVQEAAQ
jgi:spore maturation protein CgeB